MQKIVITGGFGFVGKNLVEYLLESYDLIIIDKDIDRSFLESNPVSYYKYDFSDVEYLKRILYRINPDFIINLISIVSAERDLSLFDRLIEVNFKIFLMIYEASKELKNLKLLLNFGSAEEYGPIETPFKEEDREEPLSPYALVKQFTTNTAIMLNRNYDFPVCIIRPGNLFGKYQHESKIIPYLVSKLRNNEELNLTPGEQKRDFLYIKDFCSGVNSIMKNYDKANGRIINIASGKSYSIRDIVDYIKSELNSFSVVNYGVVSYRKNEMMDFCCDISIFREITKDKFAVNIFNGLKQYLRECNL